MERKIDYTIGDEIVCVRTHSQGVVKEGQIFTCLGLKQDPCKKCGGYIVDVGVKEVYIEAYTHCGVCDTMYNPLYPNDGNWWFNAAMFRSLQKIDISEALEVLQEEPFKVK